METDTQEEEDSGKLEIFITEEDDADDEQRLVISDDRHTDSPSSSADEDAVNVSPPETQKFVKSDEEMAFSTTKSTKKESASTGSMETFSWSEYLEETGAVAAPDNCFYQDPVPPKNKFIVGRKVEVPDPRGNGVQCLATIVGIHSLWVCIRLDGEDRSNDQWLICDDECIKPVGESERNGITLQPPFGFMYNLASFHKFIENQLKPDPNGDLPTAPLESFTPISTKYHPRENKFQVGMKCEAIDRKNFCGRPCPATVVSIKGDDLTIGYDGWNKAYDIEERFDSRSIFPVGWAAKCGLEMQPPRRVKGKVIQPVIGKEASPEATHSVVRRKLKLPKRKISGTGSKDRKQKPASVAVSRRNVPDSSRASHLLDVIDQVAKHSKMETDSASTSSSGRKMTSALAADGSRTVYARKSVPWPDSLESPSNEKLESPPAKKPRKPVASPKSMCSPAAVKDIVLSMKDKSENQRMTVYLNRGCRCAPMLNTTHVRKLPEKIGPGSLHHILRETVQQIVNCAVDPSAVFEKVDPGTPRILCITAEIDGSTHVRAIPAMETVASAWTYLLQFIAKLDLCRNFLAQEPVACPLCSYSCEDGVVSTTAGGGTLKSGGESDDSEDYESRQYSDVTEWSVERVASEVENMFDKNVADKFLQNQIDGKALMLLNMELLMRHLDMPFGPALKLMSHIELLRGKAARPANSHDVK